MFGLQLSAQGGSWRLSMPDQACRARDRDLQGSSHFSWNPPFGGREGGPRIHHLVAFVQEDLGRRKVLCGRQNSESVKSGIELVERTVRGSLESNFRCKIFCKFDWILIFSCLRSSCSTRVPDSLTAVRTQPHPTNQVTGVLDRSKIEAYCRHTAVGIFYRNCWFSPLWEIICSVSKSEPFLGCSMVSFNFHEVSRWLFKDVPFSKTFSFSFVKITIRAAVVANCRLKVFQSFRQRN